MSHLTLFLLCLALPDVNAVQSPPLFEITAVSLRQAGLQHGRLARKQINAYLELDEILGYWNFSRGKGKGAYEALRQESTNAYPLYAEEINAIAEGAGVDLDQLWAANLMIELGNLMRGVADHCSDIFAIAEGGYQKGFASGHNEDWSQAVAEHMYYVKYTALTGADFESCAGLIYPGSLTGWSVAWNAHGIFQSVNTLSPKHVQIPGVTTAFIQKEAICGVGKGRSLDEVVQGLAFPHWADGASINLVDVRARRMANVETWESHHSVVEVTENMGNYSHFNMYKHLGHALDAGYVNANSTLHRQARVDVLPAARSADDIISILSDAYDKELPIFRSSTMVSHVLDGDTGRLRIWCCQHAPSSGLPIYTWNLLDFWESPHRLNTA